MGLQNCKKKITSNILLKLKTQISFVLIKTKIFLIVKIFLKYSAHLVLLFSPLRDSAVVQAGRKLFTILIRPKFHRGGLIDRNTIGRNLTQLKIGLNSQGVLGRKIVE